MVAVVGLGSLHWRSSPTWFSIGLVGLETTLPGHGKGVSNDVLGHWSETSDGVLVEEVVQSATENLGFATPDSTPMLSGGGQLMMPKNSPVRCTILALVAVAYKRDQHKNTSRRHRCGAGQTPSEG